MLLPAARVAVTAVRVQFVQAPVGAKAGVATTLPLTVTVDGRFAVPPLAQPKVSVAGPAVAVVTVQVAAAPTALVVLQNPAPENPAQLASMVPAQVAGAVSASSRPGGTVAPPGVA